jgi:CD2 antigen cytoplasmic tail-binding protein 2
MFHSSKVEAKFDKRNPSRLVREGSDEEKNEEELLLEQDIEGSRPKQKRHIVKLDFDSDSDEENKVVNQQDEDEDDMFGESAPLEDDQTAEKDKKKARFLDVTDFERNLGQMEPGERRLLANTENGIDQINPAEDDDEGEDDDEVNETNVDVNYFVNPDDVENAEQIVPTKMVSAKKYEPKIEKFNLRDDMEQGQFDEEGNFIRTAEDSEAHQDQWLSGVSKRDINRARAAHIHRLEEEEESEKNRQFIPKSELLSSLIENLDIGENSLEAMARLAPKKLVSKKKVARAGPSNASYDVINAEQERKQLVETITDACEKLLADHEVADVYDLTREELSRMYQKETGLPYVHELKRKRSTSEGNDVNNSQGRALTDSQWQFKWEGIEEIHGPYSTSQMADWVKYDYFDSRTMVRKLGDEKFLPVDQVEWTEFYS